MDRHISMDSLCKHVYVKGSSEAGKSVLCRLEAHVWMHRKVL